MGNCNARRLGRQGDAAAAEPHPPAARPDGRVPDGPHHGRRGPARHRDRAARPQPAAVRQDRHDHRPDQRLVRRRHARHRRRRLSRLRPAARRWAAMRQGGRIAAPIFKQWAQTALKDQPKMPFVAPAGHPLGAHRPGQRQAGVRRLPDHGRSEVVGDLGSVPAADRAAPLLSAAATRRPVRQATAAAGAAAAASSAQRLQRRRRASSARRPQPAPRQRRRSRSRPACQRRTRSNRAGSPSSAFEGS